MSRHIEQVEPNMSIYSYGIMFWESGQNYRVEFIYTDLNGAKIKSKMYIFSVVFDRANNNQCLISDHYRNADFVLVTCLFIDWSVWRTSHVRYILYMRALAWPVPILPFDRSIDRFVLSWLRTSHRSQIESSVQRNMRFICLFRFFIHFS